MDKEQLLEPLLKKLCERQLGIHTSNFKTNEAILYDFKAL